MRPAADDALLARDLAVDVGRLLVDRREELLSTLERPAAKDAADALAQALIAERLTAERPDDAVLSEEAPDDPARLSADRVWIVDPLDGTREYVRPGRIDWAVHVALWTRRDGLVAGAVALPAVGRVLDTVAPESAAEPAAAEMGVQTGGPADRPLRIVASASRTPLVLERIAAAVPVEVVLWGSAGAKAARVVEGDVDAYLHDTALNEWDAAAPVVVAQHHGLHVSRLDGSRVLFNQPVHVAGDLLICRRAVAPLLLDLLAG